MAGSQSGKIKFKLSGTVRFVGFFFFFQATGSGDEKNHISFKLGLSIIVSLWSERFYKPTWTQEGRIPILLCQVRGVLPGNVSWLTLYLRADFWEASTFASQGAASLC